MSKMDNDATNALEQLRSYLMDVVKGGKAYIADYSFVSMEVRLCAIRNNAPMCTVHMDDVVFHKLFPMYYRRVYSERFFVHSFMLTPEIEVMCLVRGEKNELLKAMLEEELDKQGEALLKEERAGG